MKIETYYDKLDSACLDRRREIYELKRVCSKKSIFDYYNIHGKSVIVLCYSHWEGFFKECVNYYFEFLSGIHRKVIYRDWNMLLCKIYPLMDRLYARNNNAYARLEFIDDLKHDILNCTYEFLDKKLLLDCGGNLDYKRLKLAFDIMGFDISPFLTYQNKIDRYLVGWRNMVAHGDSPEFDKFDMDEHIRFVSDLLLLLSDSFQQAAMERM